MDNFFVKSEFVLEKFKFKENFEMPSVKNMNAENVINVYEGMRNFFPNYQENSHNTTVAPKLKNILDEFEALLLDAFGVLNAGATLVPGIVKTLNIAREKNITLLVVTNGASNNSYKKREQLSSLGLEFSDEEIISSREAAEIFLSYNQPEGPLGVMGNIGDDFNIPNLNCVPLEQDYSMFEEMNSFILLGTLQWDTVWQELLFNCLLYTSPSPRD